MPKRVLITGAEGFIGSRLLPSLIREGFDASAARLDLLDFDSIVRAVSGERWDCIVHLAGLSNVAFCEQNPSSAFQVNLNGTALLSEALRRHQPGARVIFASTAQVYAPPSIEEAATGLSISEERAIFPQNTYAKSKWAAELLLKDNATRYHQPVTILRIFNHTHRTQSADFFLPHIFATLSRAPKEGLIEVPVGDLGIERDIGSVADLIRAFIQLLRTDDSRLKEFEVFNICSGTPKNLGQLATGLAARMRVQATFHRDESRIRKNEIRRLVGDPSKFSQLTGWSPNCLTETQLLDSFLNESI